MGGLPFSCGPSDVGAAEGTRICQSNCVLVCVFVGCVCVCVCVCACDALTLRAKLIVMSNFMDID